MASEYENLDVDSPARSATSRTGPGCRWLELKVTPVTRLRLLTACIGTDCKVFMFFIMFIALLYFVGDFVVAPELMR
jgi:hypothetical protein